MIRLNRYPKEKEIDTKASLCTMIALPIEFYIAKTDTAIFIKTKLKGCDCPDFYGSRALLYGFYAEDQLRREFGGTFVDAADCALQELEFQLVGRPYVSNAICGMGLQTYALKIAKTLPKVAISLLMSFHEKECREDLIGFIEKVLFGESGNIGAHYARKDGKLFIRLDLLATSDKDKQLRALKWVMKIIHYLAIHFPFSPLPNFDERSAFYPEPEFSIANAEFDVETEKRTNPLFRQYLGEKTHALSIFDIGAKWEPITHSKNAFECYELIGKVRLEAEHAVKA